VERRKPFVNVKKKKQAGSPCKLITKVIKGGGSVRSSEGTDKFEELRVNHKNGMSLLETVTWNGHKSLKSRMMGDYHVRFCERGEVQFLAPTWPTPQEFPFSGPFSGPVPGSLRVIKRQPETWQDCVLFPHLLSGLSGFFLGMPEQVRHGSEFRTEEYSNECRNRPGKAANLAGRNP
jgi:hypothetical protein